MNQRASDMSKSVRLFLSLSDDELKKFEDGRNELGFNRSQYLRYLIAGQKEIRPQAIKEREYISKLASIDRSIRAIAMKEELSDTDKMLLYSKLDELKKMIGNKRTLCPQEED